MRRSFLGWMIAFLLASGGAVFAWLWLAGGSGEPSARLSTPTITSGETASSTSTSALRDASTSSERALSTVDFVIDTERSVAGFEVEELLRGTSQKVVGTTDQLAARIRVDLSDLSATQVSEIVVNARTLHTGSEQRDRAIRGPVILHSGSDEFELITFDVESIDGLDGPAEVGDRFDFTMRGDLTIKGRTSEVIFDSTATLVDGATIEGRAATIVSREDFDIGIPSVPGLAGVEDEVRLFIDFVAVSRGR